jgi:hypothetical protein
MAEKVFKSLMIRHQLPKMGVGGERTHQVLTNLSDAAVADVLNRSTTGCECRISVRVQGGAIPWTEGNGPFLLGGGQARSGGAAGLRRIGGHGHLLKGSGCSAWQPH